MIEFHDVTVCYEPQKRHPVRSLDGVSLKIERGDWVFLVGPSGAGKSSLLKLIYAGTRAQSGRVVVDGEDISTLEPREVPLLRRKIGIVFQDFQLLSEKTAWENVAFALRVIGTPQSVIVREVPRALETVGLTHRADALPHELSGGEQQRIAIARAIVNNPPILLTDEPTGNLDPQTAREVGQLLTKINFERGTTIVMATHDGAFVDELARRVVRLKAGHIVSDENPGSYGHDNEETAPDLTPIFSPSPIKPTPLITSKSEALQPEAPQETAPIASQMTPQIEPTVAAPNPPTVFQFPEILVPEVPEVEFSPVASTFIDVERPVETPGVPLPVAELKTPAPIAIEAPPKISVPSAAAEVAVETVLETVELAKPELEMAQPASEMARPASEIAPAFTRMAPPAMEMALPATETTPPITETARSVVEMPRPIPEVPVLEAESPAPATEEVTAPKLTASEPPTLEPAAMPPEIVVPTPKIAPAPVREPVRAPTNHHDPYSVDGVQPRPAPRSEEPPLPRPMARRIAQPVPPPNGHALEADAPVANPDAPLGSPENPIVQY